MKGFLKSNSQMNRLLHDSVLTPRKRNMRSENIAAVLSFMALPWEYTLLLLLGGRYALGGGESTEVSEIPEPEGPTPETDDTDAPEYDAGVFEYTPLISLYPL